MARVRCYAGSTYPERPEAFEWEGAEKQVARILQRWRTPEAIGFRVRTEDGMIFDLIYDLRWDQWTVIPLIAPSP
ncbi:hypothetical protein [Thermoflexus sp.]|jgi:hypothetical protein|uniref:hypothetical protein n=1 Tax=Thermoflexus sp. TaxID=1969742 RepID=UPI002352A328|nr:hypothetical protein [Thermoflexus sp.]